MTLSGRHFAEYGRIAKTLYLLAYVDVDGACRQQIGAQLNIQESRHHLVRRIFHGQRASCARATAKGRKTN